MTEPGEEAAKARALGLALLDVSRIYEGFMIPSFEGRLRRRRFPPHRRAIIGLVARQRRFLRAAYTLADAGQVLEAVGPLRSMLEFLIYQCWLAHDPDRNWKLCGHDVALAIHCHVIKLGRGGQWHVGPHASLATSSRVLPQSHGYRD
jgi:hypothetical protein